MQRHRGVNSPHCGALRVVGVSRGNACSADKTQFTRSPLHTEQTDYFWGLQSPSALARPGLSQDQEPLPSPGEGGWG